MADFKIIEHAPGAPGLRFLGLGPGLWPSQGLKKLKLLFDEHAFWADNRSERELKKLLARSTVVVSVWQGKRIVGFGRATSDGIYRAVLWDVIVPKDFQGRGIGSEVMERLLSSGRIKGVERVYLMTSNSWEFYSQFNFHQVHEQKLMLRKQAKRGD